MTSKKIFIFVLLAVSGLAVFFWRRPRPISNFLPSPSSSTELRASPSPEVTADWQNYQDDLAGFSLKYPIDWTYTTDAQHPGKLWLGHPADSQANYYWLSLRVLDNPPGLSSRQWVDQVLNQNKALKYQSKKDVVVAGLAGVELFGVEAADRTDEYLYLARDKFVYYFNFPTAQQTNKEISHPAENNRIAWQIISTFKFLNGEK